MQSERTRKAGLYSSTAQKLLINTLSKYSAVARLQDLPDLAMKAKMDTSADTYAINIKRNTKNDDTWVRFTVKAGGHSVVSHYRMV